MADISDRLSRSMTSYRAKVSITPLPITASAVIGISSRRKHRYWAERTVESWAIRTSANRFRMSPTTTKNIACSRQSVFHALIDIHQFCNLSRRKHRCWSERTVSILLCSQQDWADLDYCCHGEKYRLLCAEQSLKLTVLCLSSIYKRTVIPFWEHTKAPEGRP